MKVQTRAFILTSVLVLVCCQALRAKPGCVRQPCSPAASEAAARCGNPAPTLGDATGRAVVDSLAAVIRRHYVFPAQAEKVIAALTEKVDGGGYRRAATPAGFAQALTDDLHQASNDLHFRVSIALHGDQNPAPACASVCDPAGRQPAGECIKNVQRLVGNVGYFKMEIFEAPSVGRPAADAAVAKLSGVDAFVVDLRDSPGGHHDMITAMAGYFLAQDTEIHTLHHGAQGTTRRILTRPPTGGAPHTEEPLYILTSARTRSSAEALAYDLKHLGRAVIVGEPTAGTGHCAEQRSFIFPGFDLHIRVPVYELIHPVTGTNWEGSGVEPDVAVPAGDALVEALRLIQENS